MKKFSWIAALLAALALIFTACPTGGGGEEAKPKGEGLEWWLAIDDEGTPAPDNQVVLVENDDGNVNFVRIFFQAPGRNFDEIEINFTISNNGANVSWQSIHCGELDGERTVWGATSGQDYIQYFEEGPISCDPGYLFTQQWAGADDTVNKSKMIMLCLRVNPEVGGGIFTLTDVSFIGMEAPPILQGISILSAPNKTAYLVGETFDPEGLVVEASYDKSRFDGVITGYVLKMGSVTLNANYEFVTGDAGASKIVTVSYTEGGITEDTSFTISVTALGGTITDVKLVSVPSKLDYYVGEAFSPAGISVTAKTNGVEGQATAYTLSTANIPSLTNGFIFSSGHVGAVIVVTVKYLNVEADKTFNIRVRERPLITNVIAAGNITGFGGAFLKSDETTSLVYLSDDITSAIQILPNPADGNAYRLTLNFIPAVNLSSFENFNISLSQAAGANVTIIFEDNSRVTDYTSSFSSVFKIGAKLEQTGKAVSSIELWWAAGSFTANAAFISSISFTGTYVPPTVGGEYKATNIRIVSAAGGTGGTASFNMSGVTTSNIGKEGYHKLWIYFDAPAGNYDAVKVEFEYTQGGGNISWLSAIDGTGEKNYSGSNSYIGWFGWGSASGNSTAVLATDFAGVNSSTMNAIALELQHGGDAFKISGITFTKYGN